MAFILAKRHSVPDDCHNASTESSESLIVGTQPSYISECHSHGASRVVQCSERHVPDGGAHLGAIVCARDAVVASGMSPMAEHIWGRPSVPATRSSHARMFTRSEM
eukprot:574987-Pleurochrysis_carterae.AAC.1